MKKLVLFLAFMSFTAVAQETSEAGTMAASKVIVHENEFPMATKFFKNMVPDSWHAAIFGIEVWQFIGILILLIASALLLMIFKKVTFQILKRIERVAFRIKHPKITDAIRNLSRPISLLLVIVFLKRTIPTLQLIQIADDFLFKAIEIASTVFWIFVFLKIVQVIMAYYNVYSEKSPSKIDDQLAPILNSLLKGVVIFIGVLKMLTVLGVDPAAVIAGASIGGLAVGLASQDTVKNLIGTLMIFVDKPFHIGDWIQAGDVSGEVEEVGFRSTRIRGIDTSIFQVPNSTMSEITINNFGLRLYRRYNTELGLRYDTPPELIEAFVQGVRKIIEVHPDTRSDAYNVEFIGFGDSSLNIMLNMYFISKGWDAEQAAKHHLHIAIVKIAKALGVDFAFPSTTMMLETFPEKEGFSMQYNTDPKRIDTAIEGVIKEFSA